VGVCNLAPFAQSKFSTCPIFTTAKVVLSINMASGSPPLGRLPAAPLPISQLESLKFKANQIIDSIIALQRTIEAGGHPSAMHAWPDILSKYNVLLSQTHNFSNALVQPFPTSSSSSKVPPQNIFERIALHPRTGMSDAQLDGDVIPLLRNQQTTDVLRTENETVRRLAEHMNTRGSLGVLGIASPPTHPNGFGIPKKPEYEDVLNECAEIRGAHDRRVERAVRAVMMLREKFDWKQRVEVEVEEPEELDWDPRLGKRNQGGSEEADDAAVVEATRLDVAMGSGSEDEDDEDKMGSSDEDEFNVEGVLVNGDANSPPVAVGLTT